MGARRRFIGSTAMASRWRRRSMCVLIADLPSPAALRDVSAAGAFLETCARPPLGAGIELHHPEAGAIRGVVSSLANDGIAIGFERGEASVAFAMAAIASDMSRPA
ncbi:hypothetical protein SAMN06295910_2694 [Allosphingosinicella indica]|uniref:PilZ domain-containing protein n=2 Tax=Allosphingosinicella indica TaxID=941907 RepID=A0A1X7H1R5_9SPHN|nr:hypothetical protein SAMN06295910_2694 [Allosphingosinicella indica]